MHLQGNRGWWSGLVKRVWCLEAGVSVGSVPEEHALMQPSPYAAHSFRLRKVKRLLFLKPFGWSDPEFD